MARHRAVVLGVPAIAGAALRSSLVNRRRSSCCDRLREQVFKDTLARLLPKSAAMTRAFRQADRLRQADPRRDQTAGARLPRRDTVSAVSPIPRLAAPLVSWPSMMWQNVASAVTGAADPARRASRSRSRRMASKAA